MSALLALAFCLSGSADQVSVDDLDACAARVLRARKVCGPVAVYYCLRRLGHDVSRREIDDEADVGPSGTSLQSLLDLSAAHGLPGQGLVTDPQNLEGLPAPAILVIKPAHCVVFEGLTEDGRGVRYFEPSNGQMKTVAREAMSREWTGEAIVYQSPELSWRAFLAWVGFGAAAATVMGVPVLCLVAHRYNAVTIPSTPASEPAAPAPPSSAAAAYAPIHPAAPPP